MPLYDVECKHCGIKEERIAKIDEIVRCKCGREMVRLMPSSHGICMGVGAYGYFDDNLQAYVSTNKQRRELMRQQGVSEAFGKGWT